MGKYTLEFTVWGKATKQIEADTEQQASKIAASISAADLNPLDELNIQEVNVVHLLPDNWPHV